MVGSDALWRLYIGQRHNPDPIRIEPVPVPLAALNYGVYGRLGITSISGQLCDYIATAQNTSSKNVVIVAPELGHQVRCPSKRIALRCADFTYRLQKRGGERND